MQMFDPSKYVPDMRDFALQGNDLMTKSAMANTQNMSRDFASMNELAAQRRRDKLQLQAALAQVAQRQEASRALGRRFDERMRFSRDKAAQEQANVLYDRGQKQRATDADLVAGLVGPAASGNLNALEQARTAAVMRDPSLSVRLPGESGPTTEPAPGIPSVDDVYPEETDRLRVMRGSQPVYVSPQASEMRGREAAVADLLGPNAGPWSARAVEAAGAGVTGEKAAEIARMEQNKLEGRETAERVASSRMGQQRELAGRRLEAEEPYKLHDRVRALAEDLKPERMKINEQDRQFSLVEGQLSEGANPFMQNKALAGIMRAYTGLAATNAERRGDAQAAGMWNYFDKEIDKWTSGAELPPEYRQQVMEMVRHARAESQRQIHELGLEARNRVYSSSLPFASPRDMAAYGNQAYSAVVGHGLSADQLDAEARRIEGDFAKRRGGQAAPVYGAPPGPGAAPGGALNEGLSPDAFVPPNDMGDMGGFQRGSGARDALPVVGGRPPPVPLQPPAQAPSPAAVAKDDELDAILNQLEAEYAQP